MTTNLSWGLFFFLLSDKSGGVPEAIESSRLVGLGNFDKNLMEHALKPFWEEKGDDLMSRFGHKNNEFQSTHLDGDWTTMTTATNFYYRVVNFVTFSFV